MPRGDQSTDTHERKRQARHIVHSHESRGAGHEEAERRLWATVDKDSGGGRQSGCGRGRKAVHCAARKGARRRGAAPAAQSASR